MHVNHATVHGVRLKIYALRSRLAQHTVNSVQWLYEFETRKTSAYKIINYDVYTWISLSRRSFHTNTACRTVLTGFEHVINAQTRYRNDYSEDAGRNLMGSERNTFTDFERSAYTCYIIVVEQRLYQWKYKKKYSETQIETDFFPNTVFVHIFCCDSLVCLIFP